ncbi:MAG: hypothetical protein HQL84_00290 [Magnetococcales bacterium]|nr:hypothetical protein [Magnetococcales bacterium]MBF0148467.1 hypothetical protein [Magnetococcales bacterium]MBF0172614.1 hypothetical protein [Magnetococcales bacterium]MBF0629936.1 hypothetical protein [Magnetococcales bacterium]
MALFNLYRIILVNMAKHHYVKVQEGQAFIDWISSPEEQKAIATFKVDGEALFFANVSNIEWCDSLEAL